MIASRLHQRRVAVSVNVYSKTLSPSYTETLLYTGLAATREQRDALELMTDSGAVVMVTDVFWFEPTGGSLPAITEAHLLTTGGNRYEVIQVVDQGGEGDRLRVMTRRVK